MPELDWLWFIMRLFPRPCLSVAGLPAQAVGVLQDGGLWRYGGTLTASALEPAHAAAALERWAGHVQTVRVHVPSLTCTLATNAHARANTSKCLCAMGNDCCNCAGGGFAVAGGSAVGGRWATARRRSSTERGWRC
jgi:hypothetical protein